MSTKPGVTIRPFASTSACAPPEMAPIAAIRDPVTPTSASNGSLPVPSTTRPPRITRSKWRGITADHSNGRIPGAPLEVVVLVALLRQLALIHRPLFLEVGRPLIPEDRAPLAHVIHQLRLALQQLADEAGWLRFVVAGR